MDVAPAQDLEGRLNDGYLELSSRVSTTEQLWPQATT